MGNPLVQFFGSVVAAYLVASAVWPLLQGGRQRNLVAAVLAIVGISACPTLISPEHVMARAFSCLACIDVLFRILDCARQLRIGAADSVTRRDYWTSLFPFPFLLTVYGQKRLVQQTPRLSRTELARFAASLVVVAIALLLCLQSHRVAVLRESFLLDHLTKLILLTAFAEAASQAQLAIERLCGFDAPPIINHVFGSRSPAEFWFRFNQRVRQWLYLNVFVPCGGRRSPVKGICTTFLVSAIFHEFSFALATSRLNGYQFAFFMLQAPAVLFSPRLERLARQSAGGRLAAHGLTVLWFVVTSPLFFYGVNLVFPFFYASRPWLP